MSLWLGAFILKFQYKNIPWRVLLLAYTTDTLITKVAGGILPYWVHLKPGDKSALHFILDIPNGRLPIKQNLSLKTGMFYNEQQFLSKKYFFKCGGRAL